MPFSNPVVAGTTLIREAIHSPDYVPGVSGWSINRDGSVEFNDAVIRGDLQASSIYIGENDPLLADLDQNSAIVFRWGPDRAFVISVDASGSDQYGQFSLFALHDTIDGSDLGQFVTMDYDIDDPSGWSDQIHLQTRYNGGIRIAGDAVFIHDLLDAWYDAHFRQDVVVDGTLSPAKLLNVGNYASGRVNVNPTANAITLAPVSFGKTITNPRVFVTANSAVPETQLKMVSAANVTSTGFDVALYRTNTTTTSVYWRAEGD